MTSSSNHPNQATAKTPPLRLLAWEITRRCNLACVHCRAGAENECYPDELTTEQGLRMLDDVASMGHQSVIILTGGEPLLRGDVFQMAEHGHKLGLRMVMATNGTILTPEIVDKIKESGIQRLSISLDGHTAASHDDFRAVPGSFHKALAGIELLKRGGVEFQINTTITRRNVHKLDQILELVKNLDAVAWHVFLLVPTGRGLEVADETIDAAQYEDVLHWFYDARGSLQLKATCAPHYYRIMRQRARAENVDVTMKTFGLDAITRGCLGGVGFCFLSHTGQVQPCGYLDLDCGQIKDAPFSEIWQNSNIFADLRNYGLLTGKCGRCEFVKVCGGCRARAYAATGDYLTEEPLCLYQPKRGAKAGLSSSK